MDLNLKITITLAWDWDIYMTSALVPAAAITVYLNNL